MATLNDYLAQKKEALGRLRDELRGGKAGGAVIAASASVEGRSGVRRIRIRDFQVLSDSPPSFAGYNLGPSSPELQLGVLASCLTHSFLIQAADLGVALDDLTVEVEADISQRGTLLSEPDVPVHPHNIRYVVHVSSAAGDEEIERLREAVDRFCPILNLLRRPQDISGRIARHDAGAAG